MANSKVIQHGTRKRYEKGCRCDECRAATSSYMAKYRKTRDVGALTFPHGTHHGYSCGCRCDQCVELKRSYEANKPLIDISLESFKHGSHRSYAVGCRCEKCGRAEYEYRKNLETSRNFDAQDYPHGSVKGYKLGCRCEFCMEARRIRDNAKHAYKMVNDSAYVERMRTNSRNMAKKRRACVKAKSTDEELMIKIYMSCPVGYEVDHIVPLSKGGPHTPDNVQYLPADVNRRKNNKIDFDCSGQTLRWQDVLGWPSTTIPGMGVGSSEPKCSATPARVEDIV